MVTMSCVCFVPKLLVMGVLSLILLKDNNQCLGDQNHVRHSHHEKNAAKPEPGDEAAHLNGPPPPVSLDDNVEVPDYEGYVFDVSQEQFGPQQMGGVDIKAEAHKLASKLRMLSNQEIGVTAMQAIYDSLPFSEIHPDYVQKLDELAGQLSGKFDRFFHVLRTLKNSVEHLYSLHQRQPVTHRYECCNVPTTDLRWSSMFGCFVGEQSTCDLLPSSVPLDAFNPGRNLTDVFETNMQLISSIKWQYFISTNGVHNEFPAHNYHGLLHSDCKNVHDLRHRDIYLSTILPRPKNIVIMIDHGNSLSANQLQIAKAIAKYILYSLGEVDRVGIVGLSNKTVHPRDDGCIPQRLAMLTYEAKLYFSAFIDKLEKQKSATNHTLGFEKAFEMISQTLMPDNKTVAADEAMILYISRGLLSALTDAREVLNAIAIGNGRLQHRVVINTYAVIDEGKPIFYEKSFLQYVAKQQYGQYLVKPRYSGRKPMRGEMIPVNHTQDLSSVVGDFYKSLNQPLATGAKISLPIKDEVGPGVVLPVTWPCFYENKLLGIVGLDMHFADVVEGITYFTEDKNSYAFLIDKNGYLVMHPDLKRPVRSNVQPMHTNITHFERHTGFTRVYDHIIRNQSGQMSIQVPREMDNKTYISPLLLHHNTITITYLWKHIQVEQVEDSPFILVIKVVDDGFKLRDLQSLYASSSQQLVYHRLDLLPTDHTCMHLKQLATLDTSAVFLAANAFNTPFEHLSQEETKRMVQGYLAYLNDNTGLISNPGIKEEVRKDVAAVFRINDEWLKQYQRSSLNDFIVRRYVATPSGVLWTYPGTLLDKSFDPTKREWYMRALDYPGKVTLTSPYLDVGGAGYIVTSSHTVYEGKHAALHGPFDQVVAVMGMDMTLKELYKLITNQIEMCNHPEVRCFIMEDRGYLIAHRGLIEPNGKGPLEEKHITHKEPLVANDILNHKGFVLKKLCNSFSDRTIQRYYQFNTSLDGVITNLVHGEHCAKYQVASIPGTNAFLGIVNQTCDMMRAFCPCSMVDRLCLNCHRMEQTECECPCECPLELDFCTGKLLHHQDSNPSCPPPPEDTDLVKITDEVAHKLPQCVQTNCARRKTQQDCVGVLDCEWCELQPDGVTPLKQPHCSTQRVCFAGVLGAPTPYNDQVSYQASEKEETANLRSTPVGPVAGGIMGCFLVLALGVYCYRHHMHRHSHQYITSLPDGHIRNSSMDNDIEELESLEDPGTGHTNIMLASFENPASVSPYRVNPTYRRPTNAESDLGYSTMTPHEDSEQASTTCVEPLVISRDRYRPPPGSVKSAVGTTVLPPPPSSVSSRRSQSPTQTQLCAKPQALSPETAQLLYQDPPPDGNTVLSAAKDSSRLPRQTVLPSDLLPHQVLANVQVHMVDTH